MLKISLLGRPIITLNDEPVTGFVSDKALMLLSYVVMQPSEAGHARTTLATLLWGDMPADRARANLRMALYNLQKLIPDYLQSNRKTVTWQAEMPLWLDVVEFQAGIDSGEIADLKSAVPHYRGEFMQGLGFEDAPDIEEWLRLQRESLRLRALEALDQLSRHYALQGHWEASIDVARQLLSIEPWREETHRQLMQLLARTQQFAAALMQYETCRAVLADELGVAPMPATTSLYEHIKQARQRPANLQLPQQPTPFVGREPELGQIFAHLNDPQTRLVTLAGPGGSGKTRLSIAAGAAQAYSFLDGVLFIPLANVHDEGELNTALAMALKLPAAENADERQQILSYLRQKELLLILDNVEQIVDETADLMMALLQDTLRIKCLVTSREYLRLRWETRIGLSGLPVPPADASAEEFLDYSAVALFDQIGRRVQPTFSIKGQETPIAELCRLVEGVPLAIELAAALIDQESPDQLVDQVQSSFDRLATSMRDLPSRHRSLRAVFDHSWLMLSAPSQVKFARLAIFQGEFSLKAAQAIAAVGHSLLQDFAAKSLVREVSEKRYEFHKVLYEYADQQLDELGQREQLARQHAQFFLNELEDAVTELYGPRQSAAAQRLQSDQDNLKAAFLWAAAHEDEELVIPALPVLNRFYHVTGQFKTGENVLAGALASVSEDHAEVRGALYVHHADFLHEQHEYEDVLLTLEMAQNCGISAGNLNALALLLAAKATFRLGRYDEAQASLDQALPLAAELASADLQAQCWQQQGALQEAAGDYEAAEKALNQALAWASQTGDPGRKALAYQSLAVVHFRQNRYEQTKDMLERALAVRQQIDPTGLTSARVFVNLGSVNYNLGRSDDARRYFEQAMAVFQQVGDRSGEALAADMLGRMAAFASDFSAALTLYQRALALRQDIGQQRGIADVQRHLADLFLAFGDYGQARTLLNQVRGAYDVMQDRRSLGSTMASLALVDYYQGQFQDADRRARAALETANELDNRLLQGYALKSLTYATIGQEDWSAAADVAQQAIAVWEQLDSPGMVAELRAALAYSRQHQGRTDEAQQLITQVVEHLNEQPLPDCDAPGVLYAHCVTTLRAIADPRAEQLQEQGRMIIQQQADTISDDRQRHLFEEGVDAHRQLLS